MNIVILSPSFPLNFQSFYYQLHETGAHVLGIDQKPYEELNEQLQCSLEDYYRVSDLHNYQELVNACEYFIQKYGPLDFIESHNEYWLETQANLATQFQIPGLNNSEIETVTRKSEMKKVFKSADLKTAQGGIIPSLDSAVKMAEILGYPVIVKPDRGVGATGCHKLHNESELNNFFQTKSSAQYIMEEYINGDICTFDGIVDKRGNLIYYSSLIYGEGIAEVVQKQSDTYYYTQVNIPEDLEEIGRATLNAFNIKGCIFHFEYFRLHKDGSLMPIEINRRPPGGLTLDMYNFSSDINLYQVWAQMITGKINVFEYVHKHHCMCINRRNKYIYQNIHEDILEMGKDLIVYHNRVPQAFSGAMGDYCYLTRSPNLQELIDLQEYIQNKIPAVQSEASELVQ